MGVEVKQESARIFIFEQNNSSQSQATIIMCDNSSTIKLSKILHEKKSGLYLKCLRTDRGREFTSNTFCDFCSLHGINRQLKIAYSPKQNGVSERMNKILMNVIESMMASKNVPKSFWYEAAKWASYVINRSLTLIVKNMTPEEEWNGVKPSVHHFKVFGCLAFVHIHDEYGKKIDVKSTKCVLLGVSE